MQFEFNTQLDRANCHIRAYRIAPVPEYLRNDRPHNHYSIEFHCILSGQDVITLPHEDREILLTTGNIVLLPQGIYHGVRVGETPVERFCFNFSAECDEGKSSPIIRLYQSIDRAMLFEDEVKVRQNGDGIEFDGLRRVAVRMSFDAERYITNKRRMM